MEQWVRRNPLALPIAVLGLQFGLSLGRKLYKIKTGGAQDEQVLPSPIKSLLPKISSEEAASLPYPPDAYPGIRDVESPYGSLRVYEWGPEDGRKVLLVHGISNPCVALGAIAHGLADKGCRVMMFDLPGRGFSDTPVPTPHSNRLYTTSILLALTSSPLPWTGGETFSLIGYSLGGGIVANFTSYFPSLVSSLVLLAPAGLVRQNRITLMNKILYNTGLINETTLETIIMGRIRRGDPPMRPKEPKEKPSIETAVGGEMPKERSEDVPAPPALSRIRPKATISGVIVRLYLTSLNDLLFADFFQPWQLDNHAGYVKSFMSSIRYGPIAGQHADWQRIAERLTAQNASSEERYEKEGLQNGKVLIIAGYEDVLIVEDELVQDATEILGENNVRFEFVDAGHELPLSKSKEVLEFISAFWDERFSTPMS